jgi:predicted porin
VDPTHFGLRGEGKISEGYKGGFVIEVDLRQLDVGGSGVFDNASPRVKQSYVYLSTPVGKVSLGKTGQATSGFDEIDLSNTSVAAKTLSIQPLADHLLTGADVPWIDGTERNVVRYDSPSIAGFVASASWGSAAGGENTWDVALRYAGEFQQIKVAGGVGYRHDEDVAIDLLDITQISIPTGGRDTFLVAGSLYHTPTGLFITAEWADQDWDLGLDTKGWHVKGGIEPKLTSIGRTSFYGEYGDMKLDAGGPSLDVKVWGVGIVQAIDASALDLYASYRDYDLEGESIGQFLAGARIKF